MKGSTWAILRTAPPRKQGSRLQEARGFANHGYDVLNLDRSEDGSVQEKWFSEVL